MNNLNDKDGINRETTSPLVSIVMPTFNQSEFIGDAIKSVLSQTYKNFELIIVDNFSEDATKEVVASFRDDRLKYLQFANKGIIAASRNKGIGVAKGQIIAFLDSDDLWKPEKLSKSVCALLEGADFVCSNILQFGSSGACGQSNWPVTVMDDPFSFILRRSNFVATSTVVLKKGLIEAGFNEAPEIVTAEDMDLWLKIFCDKRVKCMLLSDVLTLYRIHDGNSSSRQDFHVRAAETVLGHWKFPRGDLTSQELDNRIAGIWHSLARTAQEKGERILARKNFFKALERRKCFAKAWFHLILSYLPDHFYIIYQRIRRLNQPRVVVEFEN